MRSINPLRVFVVSVVAVVAGLAVTSAPASAHASLLSSDPQDGQTLEEAPEQVVLEFSEELDLPSTGVALVAPGGEPVDLPPLTVDGNLLIQDVNFPEPGTYTFSYRIVSVDGHPVEDSIEFTVTSVPQPSEPTAGDTESPVAADPAPADESGVGWGTVGLIAAVVLVVVVGAGFLVVRLTRRRG